MKKSLLKFISGFLFFISFFGFPALAQDNALKNSTPEDRARAQTEWMMSKLFLDPEIETMVYNINLKYSEKTHGIIKSHSSRIQKYKELKASSNAKDKELEKILTRDQYKLYKQKKGDMKDEMYQKIRERRTYNK
jgi:hypothetical protein